MSSAYIQGCINRSRSMTKTLSVTSGKGGVGKSTLVANTAVNLANLGHQVLILDGDLGMANIDIMFGMRAHKTIFNVMKGECLLQDILVEVHEGVWLIPGGSGIYELQNMSMLERHLIFDQLQDLDRRFDYLIIDTAPGIDDGVLYLNSAAQEILVAVTPDPSSITDAYALIKVLNKIHYKDRFSIVCNMVKDERESMGVFKALSDVTSQFLNVSLDFKGFVPMDPILRKATKSQQLVTNFEPRSPSGYAIRRLAEKLSHNGHMKGIDGGIQLFWQQLSGVA